jgi:hypothetical protein
MFGAFIAGTFRFTVCGVCLSSWLFLVHSSCSFVYSSLQHQVALYYIVLVKYPDWCVNKLAAC